MNGFIVGGTSAGGNLSAVLSLLARDKGLQPALTGVYLGMPLIVHHDEVPDKFIASYKSRDELVEAAIIPRDVMDLMESYHKPEPGSPLYSPLLWSTGHGKLPQTYIQVAGRDPLRSDGLIYEDVLRTAGVNVKIDTYTGMPHIFNAVWPQLEMSRRFDLDRKAGFRWLIQRQQFR